MSIFAITPSSFNSSNLFLIPNSSFYLSNSERVKRMNPVWEITLRSVKRVHSSNSTSRSWWRVHRKSSRKVVQSLVFEVRMIVDWFTPLQNCVLIQRYFVIKNVWNRQRKDWMNVLLKLSILFSGWQRRMNLFGYLDLVAILDKGKNALLMSLTEHVKDHQ